MNDRLARLIKLLELLSAGNACNAQFLANSLGCSRRSVFRDIQALKACGQSIYYDEIWGGYHLNKTDQIRSSELTESEVLALAVSASVSPIARTGDYFPDINQAIAKILARLPDDSRERIGRLIRVLRNPESEKVANPINPEHLAAVLDAFQKRSCVRIGYLSSEDSQAMSTKVSIYQINFDYSEVAIVGRSSVHRKILAIPLLAFESIELLEESYRLPQSYLRMDRISRRVVPLLDHNAPGLPSEHTAANAGAA